MAIAESFHRTLLGSGDDLSNKYPQAHDTTVHKWQIYGRVPFTAMMDEMPKVPTPSIYSNWEEHPYVRSRGEFTGAYTDSGLSQLYASGGIVGTILFIKGAEADIARIRKQDTLTVHDQVNQTDCGCFVVADPVLSGADSYITVKLTEIDTDAAFAAVSPNLAYTMLGLTSEEGAMLPQSLMTDLVHWDNQTQIFSDAFSITGSEKQEKQWYSETEDTRQYNDMIERYTQKMEWAYIKGVRGTTTGPNGKPIRRLQGVVSQIKTRMAAATLDTRIYRFKSDTAYSGQSWRTGGWNWFKAIINDTSVFDTGNNVKKLYCGSGLWQLLADAVEDRVHWQWVQSDQTYGLKIKLIQGLIRDVEIWLHPLFTENPSYNMAGFLTEAGLNRIRPFRERKMIDGQGETDDGNVWEDQTKRGLIYEGSMDWDCLENQAMIYGAALNTV